MRRLLCGAAALLVLCVVGLSPAIAATAPSGTSSTKNVVLALKVGDTAVSLGVDSATSVIAATREATASLVTGQVGTSKLDGSSRTAKRSTESGSSSTGTGVQQIAGLISIDVATGKVSTGVTAGNVTSGVTLNVGQIDFLAGLVTAGAAVVNTTTSVDGNASKVSRVVQIGNAGVLSIGDLLTRLGASPFALTCAAVEAAGAKLAVATSQACEQLAAVQQSFADATGALGGAKTQLESDLSTANGSVAGAIALANSYGVDPTGMTPEQIQAAVVAAISSRLNAVNSALSATASGTCASVSDGLAAAAASIGDSPKTAVDTACATLKTTVDGLMNTALVKADGIRVGLSTIARRGNPYADGNGVIGSIKVGALSQIGVPLDSISSSLDTTVVKVRTAAGTALTALGLGIPTPEVDLLKVAESKGVHKDGTWYADASVTALHFRLPKATLTLPSGPGLAVLTPPSTPTRPVRFAPVSLNSPEISVDLGVFSASSTFRPTGVQGTKNLPTTGVGATGLFLGGALALAGAATLRRYLVG